MLGICPALVLTSELMCPVLFQSAFSLWGQAQSMFLKLPEAQQKEKLSLSSSCRILAVVYHSGLGRVHSSASQCGQQRKRHRLVRLGLCLHPLELGDQCQPPVTYRDQEWGMGHFPKEKSGCCYQRKRSGDVKQAKTMDIHDPVPLLF